jgi:hypothetical protein
MARHHHRDNTPAPVNAAAEPPLDTEPPPPPEPADPHQADMELAAAALQADTVTLEGILAIEAGRTAMLRLAKELDSRLDRAKRVVAEFRQTIRVLKHRQYTARFSGLFAPPAGAVYSKLTQPNHFAAIVGVGKVGVDFEFVAE